MQRSNPIGWLNRPQFEERWMQLLGVVNQPLPAQGMPPEECHAHILNVCAGVQAVTSLLLSTCLRPSPGNAVFSVPMHTHRSNDVLFLGSRWVAYIKTYSLLSVVSQQACFLALGQVVSWLVCGVSWSCSCCYSVERGPTCMPTTRPLPCTTPPPPTTLPSTSTTWSGAWEKQAWGWDRCH